MDWTAEALINIIKNAGEHGNGKIEIVLENTPLFSSIMIKDNGDGIDKKHIPYIFERFYKVSSEIKPESIGIGLNLSRVIIESQNGTISVRSKRGEGTEFNITFLKTSSI
jgi:signal transduction histidine kinase